MTEIRVNTGLGMTVPRSGSSADNLISAAGFAVSLRQASAADTSTIADRPANTRQNVENTDQNAVNTRRNVQTSTENDAVHQSRTDIASDAADQGYTTEVNGQLQGEQTEVVISDELKAAIAAAMGKGGEMTDPQLTEQAKKFLEALAADEELQLELKNMLVEALHKAFEKLKDPQQQEEEFNQKVLRFLEKFLEKMNKKDDKKTALEEGKIDNSPEGLLMQMLQNMIRQMQGVQTKTTTIADAEALESQVIAPLDSVAALNTDMFESADTQNQQVIPEGKSEDVPVRTDSFVDNLETPEDLPKTAEAHNAQYQQIAQEVYDDVAEKFYQAAESKAPELAETYKVTTVSEENPAALTRLPENLQKRTRSSEEELEELKRLFGMQERKQKKPEELEETEESEEQGKQQNADTGSRKPTAAEDISKFSERLNVEAIASTEKTEAPAIARSFTLSESGVKQVLSQVVTETLNNLPQEQGEKSFSMTLNPETLGKITVRMVENAGKVSVMVTAHNKDTAELLAQRLDGMESMMKQSGTQLEKCQVVYEPEQNDRAGQQNYDGSSKNPYVRQQNEKNTDEDGRFAEELRQQAV